MTTKQVKEVINGIRNNGSVLGTPTTDIKLEAIEKLGNIPYRDAYLFALSLCDIGEAELRQDGNGDTICLTEKYRP